jgi:DNA-binding GntR family transcriptional regulator
MPTSSKDTCFEDLKRRILSTDLAPGADLDEVSVSERYGISRTPLREVLQRLAGEGYVRLEANRGAKVASMDLPTLRTFYQTAPMVYANIARMAAENRTPAQLEELGAAQSAFRAAREAGDAGGVALANHRFHRLIGEMAANPYLMACLDRLLIDHTRLSQTFYRPASEAEQALIDRAADQHDGLIAAIEARDAEVAVTLTLEHWDLSRDRLERFVRPDPLPVTLEALKDEEHAV